MNIEERNWKGRGGGERGGTMQRKEVSEGTFT